MMLRLTADLKRDHDLTPAQFEALIALQEAPEGRLSATALGRDLVYSSGSTTNLVKRLETRGLVSRTPDEVDARIVQVSLTDVGRELITTARAKHVADLEREFHPLVSDDEEAILLRFAARLHAHERQLP